MRTRQTGLHVWLAVLIISGAGGAGVSAAGTQHAKQDGKPSAAAQAVPGQVKSRKSKPIVATPSSETAPNLSSGPQNGTPMEGKLRKARRRKHAGKQPRPRATVMVKPDLSFHGILEHPRRYDPARTRHRGGAPNPRTIDVVHDHFQELDKNRDGMIDPFERALARLDIDRDLINRQR